MTLSRVSVKHDTTDCSETGNGVGNRNERRVEGGGDTPNGLVTSNTGEDEGEEDEVGDLKTEENQEADDRGDERGRHESGAARIHVLGAASGGQFALGDDFDLRLRWRRLRLLGEGVLDAVASADDVAHGEFTLLAEGKSIVDGGVPKTKLFLKFR